MTTVVVVGDVDGGAGQVVTEEFLFVCRVRYEH